MNTINSLFSQLRESRLETMNEEKEENKAQEEPKEEPKVEEPKTEDPAPVAEETEPATTNESDEEEVVSAVFCSKCGALISGINESEYDQCPCCGSEELLEKEVKVVRDGKVVKKKVRTGAKPRLSAAQRAALAKARKKAHTSSANKARAKSLKKGAAAGLHEDDILVCPECGYEGEYEDFNVDEDGNFCCPECGAVCECNTKEKKNESIEDDVLVKMLEEVEAPDFVKKALKDGKTDFVVSYLNNKMGK